MDGAATLLQGLNAIRQRRPDLSLRGIITFLVVCRHEGVSVKELAFLCRSSASAISRSIGALCAGGGLIALRYDDRDRRRVRMYLTADGCTLKDEIAGLLAEARQTGVSHVVDDLSSAYSACRRP